MPPLPPVDWEHLFAPCVSPLELMIRGTVMYLSLFCFMRFLMQREAGQIGIADLLVIVIIADASQNAMTAEYRSLTDGLVLVLTIIFWNYSLDWLALRSRWIRWIVHPPPLALIENGRVNHRHLRRELISMDELKSQLREKGVESIHDVKHAYMEGDGQISVIMREGK